MLGVIKSDRGSKGAKGGGRKGWQSADTDVWTCSGRHVDEHHCNRTEYRKIKRSICEGRGVDLGGVDGSTVAKQKLREGTT